MVKAYIATICLVCFSWAFQGEGLLGQSDFGLPADPFAVDFGPTEGVPPDSPSAGSAGEVNAQAEWEHEDEGSFAPIPLWQQLDELSACEKANAQVQFELPSAFTPAQEREIAEIEHLWNSGSFEAAILRLRALEDAGVETLAVGVQWRRPIPASERNGGPDTPVEARGLSTKATLKADPTTGNLFAVIARTDTPHWTVNMSKDRGLSWEAVYSHMNISGQATLDAAILGQYLYVACNIEGSTEARSRRFYCSSGNQDIFYGSKLIHDYGIAIREIPLTSWDYSSGTCSLEFFAILDSDELIHRYSVDGDLWKYDPSPSLMAASGLDACTSDTFAFYMVSYVNTGGNVVAALSAPEFFWVNYYFGAGDGPTGIAAYNEHIMVVYGQTSGSSRSIKYNISYDNGWTWNAGTVAQASQGQYFYSPAVTARMNAGFFVCYQEEAGAFDPCWSRHRGYGSPWETPKTYNEIDVVTGTPMSAEAIPPLPGGSGYSHGVIWLSNGGSAYFDRMDAAAGSLSAEMYSLDASTGASIDLQLSAGAGNAYRNYFMLGSLSGTSPGVPLPGGVATLPLNWDVFTDLVISIANTSVCYKFFGKLGYDGTNVARINAPPLPSSYAGVNLYFAYLLNNPYDFASNPICIKIVP